MNIFKANTISYADQIEQLRLYIVECFVRSFDYSDEHLTVVDQMKLVSQNIRFLYSVDQKIYTATQAMIKHKHQFSEYIALLSYSILSLIFF